MYITRRRTPVKKKLVQEKLKKMLRDKVCPACKGELEQLSSEDSVITYACRKCHATSSFPAASPYVQKAGREIQLNAIKLVDKSVEKKYDYKNKEKKAVAVSTDILVVIRKAMAEKKLLQFEYPKDRSLLTRVTEPYRLAYDGSKNLILWAYCTEAEGIRIFKLEKMQNAEVKTFTYEPRWGIEDKIDDDKGKEKSKA